MISARRRVANCGILTRAVKVLSKPEQQAEKPLYKPEGGDAGKE